MKGSKWSDKRADYEKAVGKRQRKPTNFFNATPTNDKPEDYRHRCRYIDSDSLNFETNQDTATNLSIKSDDITTTKAKKEKQQKKAKDHDQVLEKEVDVDVEEGDENDDEDGLKECIHGCGKWCHPKGISTHQKSCGRKFSDVEVDSEEEEADAGVEEEEGDEDEDEEEEEGDEIPEGSKECIRGSVKKKKRTLVDELKNYNQVSEGIGKVSRNEEPARKRVRTQTKRFIAKPTNDEVNVKDHHINHITGIIVTTSNSISPDQNNDKKQDYLSILSDTGSNSSDSQNNSIGGSIKKGYKISKTFYRRYGGFVVSNEAKVRHCKETNEDYEMWLVRYTDDDEEYLTWEEIEKYHREYEYTLNRKKCQYRGGASNNASSSASLASAHLSNPKDAEKYNEAFIDLADRVGFSTQEVKTVLATMNPPHGSPYCLNTAVKLIIEMKDTTATAERRPTQQYQRRQLHMLEFFAGEATVSEAFNRHSFRTRSIDNDPNSRATDRVDFMNLKWENVGTLPDVIWISTPCFTYSYLGAGKHRCPKEDQFARTPQAHQQDKYLARILWFLTWVISKKDHMIVVFENPVGLLSEMPMMRQIIQKLSMRRVKVHYCAFGRKDKKPTNLWTNDLKLSAVLSAFSTCTPETCRYYGSSHPESARGRVKSMDGGNDDDDNSNKYYNPAAIPRDLADTVAESVSATFSINDKMVRHKPEPIVTKQEIGTFNKMMGMM